MKKEDLIKKINAISDKYEISVTECQDSNKLECLAKVCEGMVDDINNKDFFVNGALRTYLLIRY